MVGKIIKGIGGFYYVHVPGDGVYECRARGKFRKQKIKPLIGDIVELAILDEENKVGNVEKIKERQNHLTRPTVANLDQAIIVFAASHPTPHPKILDRFLAIVESKYIPAIICFNKVELVPEEQLKPLIDIYEKIGYKVICTSVKENRGIDELKGLLYEKTSVFAGPSGVGKSSMLNLIQDKMVLETGEVSGKIGRGKHTTRHSELICFHDDSYVVDTPGFSSFNIEEIGADEIKHCFAEFETYEPYCMFGGCSHLNERDCGIKDAVENGDIAESRYRSYTEFMDELIPLKK
ncbi:MAG: ribosome small subunit-dependent GTPase A [Desulfovibrio sp.]